MRNTNRDFRDIVNDALARSDIIHPARAKLLHLYLDLHLYPSFGAARKFILPHVKPFHRGQYLEQLQSDISKECSKARIPEEFALWVMEWPENAIIGWAWPALDPGFDSSTGQRSKRFQRKSYFVDDSQSSVIESRAELLRRLYEEHKNGTGKTGQVRHQYEEPAHWWRTYGGNMLCLTGGEDTGENNRLCLSMEGDQLLGMFVQDHGCTMYTILLFDSGSARDGMVFDGDICDMESAAPGHRSLSGSWVESLRAELVKIENQYHN